MTLFWAAIPRRRGVHLDRQTPVVELALQIAR
jgi:hypothetical protein